MPIVTIHCRQSLILMEVLRFTLRTLVYCWMDGPKGDAAEPGASSTRVGSAARSDILNFPFRVGRR